MLDEFVHLLAVFLLASSKCFCMEGVFLPLAGQQAQLALFQSLSPLATLVNNLSVFLIVNLFLAPNRSLNSLDPQS